MTNCHGEPKDVGCQIVRVTRQGKIVFFVGFEIWESAASRCQRMNGFGFGRRFSTTQKLNFHMVADLTP